MFSVVSAAARERSPWAVAAKLVETGKPAGRILSIVMGFVTLLGFPLLTLLGVLILRLSLLARCQSLLPLKFLSAGLPIRRTNGAL